MFEIQKPPGSPGLFQTLLRLPPKARLGAGIVSMVGGGVLSAFLWDRGVVWGLPLFALVLGLFLSISGASGIRNDSRRRAMLESLARRKDELVDGLIEAKRTGKNPVRWLNEQGVEDAEIRGALLEHMKERLRAGRPSGSA